MREQLPVFQPDLPQVLPQVLLLEAVLAGDASTGARPEEAAPRARLV